MQHIPHNDRLKNIQLKLPIHPPHRHRRMVANHLRTDHRHGLTLRRIDLARHDAAPRFVFRQPQLAQATAGAGAQVANVLGDFEEGAREGVERAGALHEGVVGGEGFEFVGRGGEGGAGHFGDLGRDGAVEAGEGVEAGADGGAALSQETQVGEGGFDAGEGVGELGGVGGEFLAEGERGGVLEVGAADFDDGGEVEGFLVQGVAEVEEGGEEGLGQFEHGGDVHHCWEGVVGAGGHVDVVVGVHGGFAAFGTTEELDGAVGDDFVGVHVGLRSGAGLPDYEGEVVDQVEGGDFGGGALDGFADFGI